MKDEENIQDESNFKVYIRDSRKLAEFLAHESVDLVVSGPPYWNEVKYSEHEQQLSGIEDYQKFLTSLAQVWEASAVVLKPGGVLAFWVHDFYRGKQGDAYYVPFHADIQATMPKSLVLKQIVLWDRYLTRDKGALPAPPVGTRFVYVLIFKKAGEHPQNEKVIERSLERWYWEPVWHKKTQATLLGSKLLFRIIFYLGKPFGTSLNKVKQWINKSFAVRDVHKFAGYTTECPPEIAQRLIADFSQQGDTVLDPFLGSGTTMAVAKRMNRKCIGVEINNAALPAIKAKVRGFIIGT